MIINIFGLSLKESFPSYDPPQYTAPEVQAPQPGAATVIMQK